MKERSISEKIKSVTFDLLMQKGFAALKMDDLAKELRISKKTFYKIYPSKKAIVRVAMLANLKLVEMKLKKIINSDLQVFEKISEVLHVAGSNFGKIKNDKLYDLKVNYSELWDEVEKFRKEKIFVQIEKLFYEAKEKGIIKQEINIEVLIMIFESSVLQIINPTILSEHSFSAIEALKSIISTIFYGALNPNENQNLSLNNLPSQTKN